MFQGFSPTHPTEPLSLGISLLTYSTFPFALLHKKKWAASNLQNYIAYSHYQGRAAKILTSRFTCDVIRQSCLPPAPAREFWIFYAAQLILSRETFAVKRKVAIYNFCGNTFALQSVLILTSSKIKSVMIVSSGKLKLYPTVQRQTLQNQCFVLATTDGTIAHKQGEKVSLKKSKNHVIYSVRLVIISRVRIGFARGLACFLVPVPCLERI